jgi:hypothetical protein
MNKQSLANLRKNLSADDRKKLSEKFNLTVDSIGQILLGNRNNDKVIIAAVEIVSEHLEKKQRAEEFLQNL